MTVTALKATILGAAVTLARKNGLHRLTRLDVACAAECGTGTVSYHFGDMDGLTNAVVEYAVQHEVLEILAQARIDKHPSLRRVSAELKARVAAYLAL
jgi:AcrR family transcriptional regulator